MVSQSSGHARVESYNSITQSVLDHMIHQINASWAQTQPFGHVYFNDIFPPEIYRELLRNLPAATQYRRSAERHHRGEAGGYVRSQFALTWAGVNQLPARQRAFWRGIAAALTAPELKRALYAKLEADLAYRYGVTKERVTDLDGFSRPTLYREVEGFEIPPHPDTRKKVVTMHLYLPADSSQGDLGTALYRRRLLAWPFGAWQKRFDKMKQFEFRPNSGYAFVVNNTLFKKSWHGRERLRPGAGIRNTLLNTFYEAPRNEFGDYLIPNSERETIENWNPEWAARYETR